MLANVILSMVLPAAAAGLPVGPETQDPPVRVSLDENGDYYPGHFAQVDVRTDFDGFILILHLDPVGNLRVLFPLEPYDDGFVEGGKGYEIVNRSGRGAFYVGESPGIGTVFVAYSEWPFQVKGYTTERRWNYDALWIPPDGDVETAMVDLVAKMAYDGWFDYDLVDYEVYGEGDSYADAGYRIAYEPVYICCSPAYIDPWVGFGVSISFGSPYPYYGYPYYFSYYPGRYYYRPYYRGHTYASHYYTGSRGYYGNRRYRFKQPYEYDRGRGTDPYRPRGGVGIQPDRVALGPDRDGVGYRGRRVPSNPSPGASGGRRGTPVATGGSQPNGGRRGGGGDRSPSYTGPERVRTSPPILIDRGSTGQGGGAGGGGRRTTPGSGGTTFERPVGTRQPILIDRSEGSPTPRRSSPGGSVPTVERPAAGGRQPVLIDRGSAGPTGRRSNPRGSGATIERPNRAGATPVLIDRSGLGSPSRRTSGQTSRSQPVLRAGSAPSRRTGPSGARQSPTRTSRPTVSQRSQPRSADRSVGSASRSSRPVSRPRASSSSRQPSRSVSRPAPAPRRSARPSGGSRSRAPAQRSKPKRRNN